VTKAQPLDKSASGKADASAGSMLALVFDKAVLRDGREVPLTRRFKPYRQPSRMLRSVPKWAAPAHPRSGRAWARRVPRAGDSSAALAARWRVAWALRAAWPVASVMV